MEEYISFYLFTDNELDSVESRNIYYVVSDDGPNNILRGNLKGRYNRLGQYVVPRNNIKEFVRLVRESKGKPERYVKKNLRKIVNSWQSVREEIID